MKFQHIYVVYLVTIDEVSVCPTLSYMTIDDATLTLQFVKGMMLAKINLQSVLLVAPSAPSRLTS